MAARRWRRPHGNSSGGDQLNQSFIFIENKLDLPAKLECLKEFDSMEKYSYYLPDFSAKNSERLLKKIKKVNF